MKKTIMLLCLMFAGCGYGIRIVDTDDEWKMKLIRKNIEIISLYMTIDSLETALYECKEGNAMSKYQQQLSDSLITQRDVEMYLRSIERQRKAKQ